MAILPMFPLGSVLLPSVFLPLHVFEDRYRLLVRDCLAGDREFGVVLIERGSEVGGGEVRTMAGTVAQIIEATEFDDGRWALGAVGTRRIRVIEWLDDQPYPCAEIEEWCDPTPTEALPAAVAATMSRLRRVLAQKAELGEVAAPATIDLIHDPVLASYQLAAVAPFGPSDRQALLEADSPEARVAALDQLLDEEAEFLVRRLELATSDDDEQRP